MPTSPAPSTSDVRPFLRWAGGKGRLLDQLEPLVPAALDGYAEPFVGGGALLLALARGGKLPDRVAVNDLNAELVNVYSVCADPDLLEVATAELDDLFAHFADAWEAGGKGAASAVYYDVRGPASDRETSGRTYADGGRGSFNGPLEVPLPDVLDLPGGRRALRAAKFVFLNRTCFNGLWRVNRHGRFNVPFGQIRKPPAQQVAARMRAVGRALSSLTVTAGDYRRTAVGGDGATLWYFDPPYIPHTADAASDFANTFDYADGGFGLADHLDLAAHAIGKVNGGQHVMLSNADDPVGAARTVFAGLFAGGPTGAHLDVAHAVAQAADRRGGMPELADGRSWTLLGVTAMRSISARAGRRGGVPEIVGVSWGPDDVPDVAAVRDAGVGFLCGAGPHADAWRDALDTAGTYDQMTMTA